MTPLPFSTTPCPCGDAVCQHFIKPSYDGRWSEDHAKLLTLSGNIAFLQRRLIMTAGRTKRALLSSLIDELSKEQRALTAELWP